MILILFVLLNEAIAVLDSTFTASRAVDCSLDAS